LQCAVAWLVAWQDKSLPGRSLKLLTFALLALATLLVFAFGLSSE
jgi:hypothetical protein